MIKATLRAAILIAAALLISPQASMAVHDEVRDHRSDLDWAITMGDTDTALDLLWDHPVLANEVVNPATLSFPIHETAARNELVLLRKLLTMKVYLDVTDMNGDTAVHRAAANGHKDAVKLLMDAGAKIGIQNKNGKTAGMLAAENGNDEIARMLGQGGAVSAYKPPVAEEEPMAQEPADEQPMAEEPAPMEEPMAEEPAPVEEKKPSEPLRLVEAGGMVLEPVTFKGQGPSEPVKMEPSKVPQKKIEVKSADTSWGTKAPSGGLRIKALSGDGGMLSVREIEKQLTELGYKVERIDVAPFKFDSLTVFYNKGYQGEAEEMAAKIKARVKPMSWESVFDLIVVSGKVLPPVK